MVDQSSNKKNISRTLLKVIIVNVLNLAVLVGTFYFLSKLPSQAVDVRTRNTQIQAQNHTVDATVIKAEIERNKSKIDSVSSLLSGDETVISFVMSMDQLKKEGIVSEYEFPVTSEISDKTGLKGLPVFITIKGTKQNISDTLVAISKLKVLVRPVTLNLTADELGMYTAKFGGFVYTQ